MLSYILITYILSIFGYFFYKLFIAEKVGLKAQRNSLHLILLSCLIIPLLVSFSYTDNLLNTKVVDAEESYIDICANFCPDEEAINQCYNLAIADEEFCSCISVEKENIIVYEGNTFFNFFINNEKILKDGFISLALLILLLFVCKLISLRLIISRSKKTEIAIKDEKYILLKPNINLPVSSFRLIDKYIIWDESLNYLSENEKRAIFYHEMAHIKHHDTWYKILENLLNIVWVLNPIFYLFKKEMQSLYEFLADEFAVNKIGDVGFYAKLLLKIKKQETLNLMQGFKSASLTKIRIQKIFEQNEKSSSSAFPKVILAFLLFTVISFYSLDFLNKENSKLTIYKELLHKNSKTGKSVFCKQCLVKEIKRVKDQW